MDSDQERQLTLNVIKMLLDAVFKGGTAHIVEYDLDLNPLDRAAELSVKILIPLKDLEL